MIRVGTRASALARTQAGAVARDIAVLTARPTALVDVVTTGDRLRGSLRSIGGSGVFVSALRDSLRAGEVDVAVHSLKDLPTAPTPGIVLAAVPAREDPRDALVSRVGGLAELPAGARVGTGSPRRAAMVRAAAARVGTPLAVVDIRGNVPTRLARVGDDLDAVVLAAAGLNRLGRSDVISELLPVTDVVPCAGQGALAIEVRADDPLAVELAALDDPPSRAAVTAERAVLAGLDAGCATPVGALATVTGSDLRLLAALDPAVDAALEPLPGSPGISPPGTSLPGPPGTPLLDLLRVELSAPVVEAERLGWAAAGALLDLLPPGVLTAPAGRVGTAFPARSPHEERVP